MQTLGLSNYPEAFTEERPSNKLNKIVASSVLPLAAFGALSVPAQAQFASVSGAAPATAVSTTPVSAAFRAGFERGSQSYQAVVSSDAAGLTDAKTGPAKLDQAINVLTTAQSNLASAWSGAPDGAKGEVAGKIAKFYQVTDSALRSAPAAANCTLPGQSEPVGSPLAVNADLDHVKGQLKMVSDDAAALEACIAPAAKKGILDHDTALAFVPFAGGFAMGHKAKKDGASGPIIGNNGAAGSVLVNSQAIATLVQPAGGATSETASVSSAASAIGSRPATTQTMALNQQ